MASVEMRVDLSQLIDTLVAGNKKDIIDAARTYLLQKDEHIDASEAASVIIGRVGMIAAHGDPAGHIIITLTAAAMLCRLLHWLPLPPDTAAEQENELVLPLFAQALVIAAPAVKAGHNVQPRYPDPFFPSALPQGKTVNDKMHDAVYSNDALLTERLLFGLYGTGADYRTMQVRPYEALATTFQDAGHPLIFAVRGYQLLDTVEWGDRAPNIIHWLAPHLPLRPDANEPDWVDVVRNFANDPAHNLSGLRTRLSAPKNENALPLRRTILSDADTTQVCQAVYDALVKGEASSRAVGSVIALAAADIMQMIDDDDRERFVHAAHGLLFSAAVRLAFEQTREDVLVLPMLFTSAAYVNALQKEIAARQTAQPPRAPTTTGGGGLIAASQLATLREQLNAQDLAGALITARRYLRLGHDARALFGAIGIVAARTDASADQGHTLQIVQAAGEEYRAWPAALAETNIESFLQVALRAATFGTQDALISQL
jgi:hypothetical protein